MRAPWLLPALLGATVALRPAPAAGRLDVRAKYEEALVNTALLRKHLLPDPHPEGKVIERILVDSSEPILPGDLPLAGKVPWTWLNYLHVKTRDPVIIRELLFRIGDRYRTDVIEESGRNLRRLFILTIARIVATEGSAPDRVVILVVTKDNWSLRPNSSFGIDQVRLDYLTLSLSENNLAGRNKTVAFDFGLDPGRYTIGASYTDPRVWGSRHFLQTTADFYLNRQDSSLEGGLGYLAVGRPLFSLRTRWAWNASFTFLKDKVRSFSGGDIRQFCYRAQPPADANAPCEEPDELLPFIYSRQRVSGQIEGTRSWGVVNKVNLTAGFRVTSVQYGLTEEFPAEASPMARAAFAARVLPRSESASGPYMELSAYRAEYVRLKNIDIFDISEDVRIGPEAYLGVRWANHNFGFSSDFVDVSASYFHRFRFGDDLLSYGAGVAARFQEGVWPGALLVNEELTASVRNISPRFGIFRLHVAARVQLRARDLNNTRLTLGSDSGLRGYAPRALQGNNAYLVNVELRTMALNLWTLLVGGVLFYDGGDAPLSMLRPGWRQSAGIGARVLIPQFNKTVLRLDLAFPFELTGASYEPRFSVEFGQAF